MNNAVMPKEHRNNAHNTGQSPDQSVRKPLGDLDFMPTPNYMPPPKMQRPNEDSHLLMSPDNEAEKAYQLKGFDNSSPGTAGHLFLEQYKAQDPTPTFLQKPTSVSIFRNPSIVDLSSTGNIYSKEFRLVALLSSPCSSKTLCILKNEGNPSWEAVFNVVVLVDNTTFRRVKTFCNFENPSFVPNKTLICGYTTLAFMEESSMTKLMARVSKKKSMQNLSQERVLATYDYRAEKWLTSRAAEAYQPRINQASPVQDKEDKPPKIVETNPSKLENFSCYLSSKMTQKSANEVSLNDVIGLMSGPLQVANSKITEWRGSVIFYPLIDFVSDTKDQAGEVDNSRNRDDTENSDMEGSETLMPLSDEEMDVQGEKERIYFGDYHLEISVKGPLEEFRKENDKEKPLTIFPVKGCTQVVVFGQERQDPHNYIMVTYRASLRDKNPYAKVDPNKVKEDSDKTLYLHLEKDSNTWTLHPQISNAYKVSIESAFYDPLTTAFSKFPAYLVFQIQKKEFPVKYITMLQKMGSGTKTNELIINDSSSSLRIFGRNSECSIVVNNQKVQIMVQNNSENLKEGSPDFKECLFDLELTKKVNFLSMTPNLRQVWFSLRDEKSQELHVCQVNLLNNPSVLYQIVPPPECSILQKLDHPKLNEVEDPRKKRKNANDLNNLTCHLMMADHQEVFVFNDTISVRDFSVKTPESDSITKRLSKEILQDIKYHPEKDKILQICKIDNPLTTDYNPEEFNLVVLKNSSNSIFVYKLDKHLKRTGFKHIEGQASTFAHNSSLREVFLEKTQCKLSYLEAERKIQIKDLRNEDPCVEISLDTINESIRAHRRIQLTTGDLTSTLQFTNAEIESHLDNVILQRVGGYLGLFNLTFTSLLKTKQTARIRRNQMVALHGIDQLLILKPCVRLVRNEGKMKFFIDLGKQEDFLSPVQVDVYTLSDPKTPTFLVYTNKMFKLYQDMEWTKDHEKEKKKSMGKEKLLVERTGDFIAKPVLSADHSEIYYIDSSYQIKVVSIKLERKRKKESHAMNYKRFNLNLKKFSEGMNADPKKESQLIKDAREGKYDEILLAIPENSYFVDLLVQKGKEIDPPLIEPKKESSPVKASLKLLPSNSEPIDESQEEEEKEVKVEEIKPVKKITKDFLCVLSTLEKMFHVRIFSISSRTLLYYFKAEMPIKFKEGLKEHSYWQRCFHIEENYFHAAYFNIHSRDKVELLHDFRENSNLSALPVIRYLEDEYTVWKANKSKRTRELIKITDQILNLSQTNLNCEASNFLKHIKTFNDIRLIVSLLNSCSPEIVVNQENYLDFGDIEEVQKDILLDKVERLTGIVSHYPLIQKQEGETSPAADKEGKKSKDDSTLFTRNIQDEFLKKVRAIAEEDLNYMVFGYGDTQKAQRHVIQDRDEFLKEDIERNIFKLLLQTKTGVTITCQLPDEDKRTFPFLVEHGVKNELDRLKSSLEGKAAENYTTYEVYRSLVKLDLRAGSSASTKFFKAIKKLEDKDLEGPMRPLIYMMWSNLFWYALLLTFMYLAMTICVYFYFGLYPHDKGLGISVCLLNSFWIFYELKTAKGLQFSYYYRSLWNWVDIPVQAFSLAIAIVVLVGADPTTKVIGWLRFFTIGLIYFRALTWFRLLKDTRYLITMLYEVFKDMLAFMAVFLACIIGFTMLWLISPFLSDPLDGQSTVEVLSYYDAFYVTIYMIFGQVPAVEPFNQEKLRGIRFVIVCGIYLVQNIIFLNFLIAFINGTFSRVNEKKVLYDTKELLDLIEDFNSFLHGLTWAGRKELRFSYFTLMPVIEKGDDLIEIIKVKEEITNTKEPIISKLEEIHASHDDLKNKLDKLEQKIATIEINHQNKIKELGKKAADRKEKDQPAQMILSELDPQPLVNKKPSEEVKKVTKKHPKFNRANSFDKFQAESPSELKHSKEVDHLKQLHDLMTPIKPLDLKKKGKEEKPKMPS